MQMVRRLNIRRRMKRIICLLLLATTGVAFADDARVDDHGYVATSWAILFTAADAATGVLGLEGAYRLAPKRPFLLRAFLGRGTGADGGEDTRTTLYHARVGIEVDSCTPGRGACVFAGGDAGWRLSETSTRGPDAMTSDTSGSVYVGRLGVDLGGDYLRVRIETELTSDGGGIQLALMHRFY